MLDTKVRFYNKKRIRESLILNNYQKYLGFLFLINHHKHQNDIVLDKLLQLFLGLHHH